MIRRLPALAGRTRHVGLTAPQQLKRPVGTVGVRRDHPARRIGHRRQCVRQIVVVRKVISVRADFLAASLYVAACVVTRDCIGLPLPFQIDTIIAEQHAGQTVFENLALDCPNCNRYKGPNIAGLRLRFQLRGSIPETIQE